MNCTYPVPPIASIVTIGLRGKFIHHDESRRATVEVEAQGGAQEVKEEDRDSFRLLGDQGERMGKGEKRKRKLRSLDPKLSLTTSGEIR